MIWNWFRSSKEKAYEVEISKLQSKIRKMLEVKFDDLQKLDTIVRAAKVFLELKNIIKPGMSIEETKRIINHCDTAVRALLSYDEVVEYEFWDRIYKDINDHTDAIEESDE